MGGKVSLFYRNVIHTHHKRQGQVQLLLLCHLCTSVKKKCVKEFMDSNFKRE